MSIVKNEQWDVLTQIHEDFIKKVRSSGYPLWMIDYYPEPTPKKETEQPKSN